MTWQQVTGRPRSFLNSTRVAAARNKREKIHVHKKSVFSCQAAIADWTANYKCVHARVCVYTYIEKVQICAKVKNYYHQLRHVGPKYVEI